MCDALSPGRRLFGAWPLEDGQRRAERKDLRQPQDVAVEHPDAAVRDAAREELREARPVDADEATPGPVRQYRRAGARAEGDRPVEGIAEPEQHLAHVELAVRRRPVRLADADPRDEDRPPGP